MIRRLVVDTNVLVSAALSPSGVCGELLRLVVGRGDVLLVDDRVSSEYEGVLRRSRFGLSSSAVDAFLAPIRERCMPVLAQPFDGALIDENDRAFVEVAIAGRADIVTGNTKHFPSSLPVRVLSPRALLTELQ